MREKKPFKTFAGNDRKEAEKYKWKRYATPASVVADSSSHPCYAGRKEQRVSSFAAMAYPMNAMALKPMTG